MTPWQTALTVAILASAAVSLAALAVVVWLWRGMRDERDEMEARRRMAVAEARSANVRLVQPVAVDGRVIADELKRYKARGGDVL